MQALVDIPERRELRRELALELLLEGLTLLNVALIERYKLPPLYAAGVVYQRDAPGIERWSHALDVLRRGWDDCDSLAAYRAAELRVHEGIPAYVLVRRTGPTTLHAVVGLDGVEIDDPAKRLGM